VESFGGHLRDGAATAGSELVVGVGVEAGVGDRVWDFRPGVRPHPFGPRHAHLPDPVQHTRGGPLQAVTVTPWLWPWRLAVTQRIELVRVAASPR
jgi:hypothetical protein